jgi:hypothetical protein
MSESAANMTAEELGIRGIVSLMPKEQQDHINDAYAKLQAIVDEFGEDGAIAFALLGCKLQRELP